MLFPLTLYHWYSKRVGLLDQDPRPVLSTEPTLTEEGPGIEGRTEFKGRRGGTTLIGLLVAGALLPLALVATTWHVILKPISLGDTVLYEAAV
jgi:hypothetical protein